MVIFIEDTLKHIARIISRTGDASPSSITTNISFLFNSLTEGIVSESISSKPIGLASLIFNCKEEKFDEYPAVIEGYCELKKHSHHCISL